MIFGVGTDIVDINRFTLVCERQRNVPQHLFSQEELDYCWHEGSGEQSLAGFFAVKEAVVKALGTVPGFQWQDIMISHLTRGKPVVKLQGALQQYALDCGVNQIEVSIAHENDFAVAFVVALKE